MLLPRLEAVSRLASDREVTRDALRLAQLREDYRYLAAVCRNVLPHLEEELADLPDPFAAGAPVEVRVAYQMTLVRRCNRLHRAVAAEVRRHGAGAQAADG
ncbi:MAG: hypothetical protein ABR573_04180 [Candidatus Dormibacteria bacterium]